MNSLRQRNPRRVQETFTEVRDGVGPEGSFRSFLTPYYGY